MHGAGNTVLPFTDPVLIFALALFIIFLAPIAFKKLRIPSIIGLLLAGVIIGPHGFYLIERSDSIVLLGTVGLLYIMFLAGLELDFNQFRETRNRSIVFGMLTFFVPFIMGYYVFRVLLDYPVASSVLIASMFSTHTLISYPIVSRLGITRNEVVPIAIGGTIITDTAVLLVLALVTSGSLGSGSEYWWLRMLVGLIAFGIVLFYLYPLIGRWFFSKIEPEGTSQFIFVLSLVFLSSFLAQLAGMEPIIGAFFAGLTLNRLIPRSSTLMNRLEFVGNAIFIPFFLISVGMLIDVKLVVTGYSTLIMAGILTFIALLSKYLAAVFTGLIYRFSYTRIRLLYGLSSAHAAAILAVIVTGYELKLVDDSILNGTFVIILISCLVSSIITEKAGRKLALQQTERPDPAEMQAEKFLVPIANVSRAEHLISMAVLSRGQSSSTSVHPLTVVLDGEKAQENVFRNIRSIESIVGQMYQEVRNIRVVSRIDVNISAGIIRAAREMMISRIYLGWSERIRTTDFIFGSILETLLANCHQMFVISRLDKPVNLHNQIVVWVPEHAGFEAGFAQWLDFVAVLGRECSMKAVFMGSRSSLEIIRTRPEWLRHHIKAQFITDQNFESLVDNPPAMAPNDLFIAVSARKGSISYHNSFEMLPEVINKSYERNNAIIIYPLQRESEQGLLMGADGMNAPDLLGSLQQIPESGKLAGTWLWRLLALFNPLRKKDRSR